MKELNNWKSPNVLNVYRFGSMVYGTNRIGSDEDFYVVQEVYTASNCTDNHHISSLEFQQLLDNQDIQAIECFFLDPVNVFKETVQFTYKLDKVKLRTSISAVCDNSWVKGKKKLIVSADYNKKLALKSIFHSLRIRDLGIQIALYGKIISYMRMNYIFDDLLKLGEQYERIELWDAIDTKYRKEYNSLRSQFVELCPKGNNRQIKIDKVRKMLKDNNQELSLDLIKNIVDEIG
tara:strand:- start:731 stop:1432 length:702 start_codon:yes stop_codon:yes gene_type:complete